MYYRRGIDEMTVKLLEEQQSRKTDADKEDKHGEGKNGDAASGKVDVSANTSEASAAQNANVDKFVKEFTDSLGYLYKSVLKIDATCSNAEVYYSVDFYIIHDDTES